MENEDSMKVCLKNDDLYFSSGFEDIYTVSLASPGDLQSIGFRMGHALKLLQACGKFLAYGRAIGGQIPGADPDADVIGPNDLPLDDAMDAPPSGRPVSKLMENEKFEMIRAKLEHREQAELSRTSNGTAALFSKYTGSDFINPKKGETNGALAKAERVFFKERLSKGFGKSSKEPERRKNAEAAAVYMSSLLSNHFHGWRRVSVRQTYVQSVLLQQLVGNYQKELSRAFGYWTAFTVGTRAGEIARDTPPPGVFLDPYEDSSTENEDYSLEK